jgi:glycosyltransferase involved in cell wall biosynthesis
LNPNRINRFLLWNDRRVEAKFLKKTDIVTFVSDQLFGEVSKRFEFDLKKVIVVNNGIDNNAIQNRSIINATNLLKEDSFNVTFIGSIYEGHHISYLYYTLQQFSNFDIENVNFYFVGSLISCTSNKKDELLALKKEFPNNVFFIDYLENSVCLDLQKESTILLKFNLFEQKKGHFGKKLYEYAIAGKKVICINKEPNFKNETGFFDDKPFMYSCNNEKETFEKMLTFYQFWVEGKILHNEITMNDLDFFTVKRQVNVLEKKIQQLVN